MISEGSCDTEDWSNDAENCFSMFQTTYFVSQKASVRSKYCHYLAV